jgi:hypothetical protein
MHLYQIELDSSFSYTQYLQYPVLHTLHLSWDKDSYHPEHVSNPPTNAIADLQAELQASWDQLSIESVKELYPEKLTIKWGTRNIVVPHEQFVVLYKHGTIKQIIEVETPPLIDLDLLAEKIANKLTKN